jgi:hypothetical protein
MIPIHQIWFDKDPAKHDCQKIPEKYQTCVDTVRKYHRGPIFRHYFWTWTRFLKL